MADTSGVWATNGSDPLSGLTGADGTSGTKKSQSLDMEGFLKIMSAQMQNQSMDSNPTDNTQYVTEMALFSAINALNTMTSENNKQYAAALVGEQVVLAVPDSDGNKKLVAGTVEKACYNSKGSYIILKGKEDTYYSVDDITEVLGFSNNTPTDTTSKAT